jgi:hypothetical protein
VILLGLMAITQAALIYLAQQAALTAARHGTDAARVLHAQPGAGNAAAMSFATTVASGYLQHPGATTGANGPTIQITVTGDVPSIVPGLTFHVSETARAPVERFTTP